MLAALAQGPTLIRRPLRAGDTLSTAQVMRHLGAQITDQDQDFLVLGRGLVEPEEVLDCGNSGTLIRLLAGILAGQNFHSVLTGDASLRSRPMDRVTVPLRLMGAKIDGRQQGRLAPLTIRGGELHGIDYTLPVASAQVKSALLLAGIFAAGATEIQEPMPTRDHTERIFRHFGIPVEQVGGTIRTRRAPEFQGRDLVVPGDFSSAAFFIGAGLVVPGSDILLEGVGLNPTRTGLIQVLEAMGAELSYQVTGGQDAEPWGWIRARASGLHGVEVSAEQVAGMIDEIPVLAAVAAWAEGVTEIRGLTELRVKESDRLSAISANLAALGVESESGPDWIRIKGGGVQPGRVQAFDDHRIAMAFAVAGLPVGVRVTGAEWAGISFPGFFPTLEGLR